MQESATLRPAAAEVLQEVRRIANVYVIAHVADDLGEATVRGALEAGKPHRPVILNFNFPFAPEVIRLVYDLVCLWQEDSVHIFSKNSMAERTMYCSMICLHGGMMWMKARCRWDDGRIAFHRDLSSPMWEEEISAAFSMSMFKKGHGLQVG